MSGGLTALVVSAAFVALRIGIRARAEAVLADELAVHQRTLIATERRTLAELLATSLLIGDSPALQAALETYRLESAAGGALRSQALRTVREETARIAGFLAHDLLVVTDSQGRVLVASDRTGEALGARADLSTLTAVRRSLEGAEPGEDSSFAVVRFHGDLFQLGAVPLLARGFPVGTLVLGNRLDAAACTSRSSGARPS